MQQQASERSRSERLQIVLALISVGGALLVGTLSNWDKLFPGTATATATATTAMASSIAEPGGSFAPPPPLTEAAALGAAQRRVLADSTAALNAVAEQIETGVASHLGSDVRAETGRTPPARPDISGLWHGAPGTRFVFTQQGDDYTYVHYANGVQVGVGQGRLDGRNFRHDFAGQGVRGSCTGALSTDDQRARAECSSGGIPWSFTVWR